MSKCITEKTILAKRLFKSLAILLLYSAFPAFSACEDLNAFAVKSKDTRVICDEQLGVLYGYDILNKEPAWAVYFLNLGASHLFVRNRGVYGLIPGIAATYQRSSVEFSKAGLDKGLLVPPNSVVDNPGFIENAYRMSNVFPIQQSHWRGNFGTLMHKLTIREKQLPLERGNVVVVTGIVSGAPTADSNGIPMPSFLYKIYFSRQYDLTLSYLVPISSVITKVDQFITSIDCIESVSSHDIFHQFEGARQSDIENSTALNHKLWAVRDGDTRESSCAN